MIDTVGHLCDYILFDSAWVGYEQFIPMMADSSPLLLELNENDPGIFVTQSVHKQQAGFSQTSQIHKKDNHIRGQARFCPHKRLNNAFMLHASTSLSIRCLLHWMLTPKFMKGRVGVGCGLSALSWVLSRARLFLRAVSCSARLSRPLLMANCGRIIRRLC